MQTFDNQNKENFTNGSPKNHNVVIGLLAGGLVLALAGNGYMMVRANHLSEDLAKTETASQTQISKLGDSTQAMLAQNKAQLDQATEQMRKDVKTANDSAFFAVRKARTDAQIHTEEMATKLAEQQQQQEQQVTARLSQLKDTTDSKFTEVSGNVDTVKSNVEEVKTNLTNTQNDLTKNIADLRQVMGDMGVMSGRIATNQKDLDALRALGERNYYEFDMTRQQGQRKIGDVTLALRKSDSKRNRFTLDVLADDKKVEKKDKTVNEPVQFYVAGNRQPYEIVVNQVSKDRVMGYLSTPKVKLARQ